MPKKAVEDEGDAEVKSPVAGTKRSRAQASAAKTPAKSPVKGKATPAAKAKATPKTAAKAKATPASKAKPAAKSTKKATKGEDEEEVASDAEGVAEAPKAKRRAKASAADGEEEARPSAKKLKELKPLEMLEAAMKAYKWWEAEPLPKGVKWKTMEHNGVCFPPAYVPHGIKMKYDGNDVDLTPDQEELATFYASIAKDGPQLGVPKTAKIFNKNFFADFRESLGKEHLIQKFELCDFDPIREHLDKKREEKKALPKAEKEAAKIEKTATQLKYGFALVDGHLEKMGNYTVEPPGLFRGRGEHPKMGTLKRRVIPEEISINLGSGAVVPPCPLPGHAWKRVVHDPTVTWLAYWKENVMSNTKYVFLAASSSFKGKSDLAKYEKARRLKKYITKIREHYEKLLSDDDDFKRQSGTAMWFIDRLALRVGGEKDEDEADTVGCCSLRVEHISFPSDHEVTLDFLGKDSMRYHQTIELERYGDIGRLVLKNLKKFSSKKKKEEDVFDELTPARLNEQLDELMPGLSAKVFRTYNASYTLEKELVEMHMDTPAAEKVLEYNRANREVAILCNHQRTVPKAFTAAWEKMTLKEALLKSQLEELQAMVPKVKKGDKVKLKSTETAAKADAGDSPDGETDAARQKRIAAEEAHLFSKQPSADELQKRIKSWAEKLEKLQTEMRNKDENKAVALGTSKINYMDPRITVAWCKRVELPIEKVFARTLRDKFPWAMGVPSAFKF